MAKQVNEIGFSLCQVQGNGRLTHGPVSEGTPTSVDIKVECPAGSKLIGLHHTHPGGVAFPSPTDLASARAIGAQVMCINADGQYQCFGLKE